MRTTRVVFAILASVACAALIGGWQALRGAAQDAADASSADSPAAAPGAADASAAEQPKPDEPPSVFTYRLPKSLQLEALKALRVRVKAAETNLAGGAFVEIYARDPSKSDDDEAKFVKVGEAAIFKPLAKGGTMPVIVTDVSPALWSTDADRQQIELQVRLRPSRANASAPTEELQIERVRSAR